MNPLQLAAQMMQKNPNLANNPEAQRMLSVLQNGSQEEQKQLAQEICQARGISLEEGVQQAKSYFNLQ